MKIYPAIDLIEGNCVRLHKGDFDQVTRYSEDPVAMAESFAAAGAKHLHIVDLDGARTGGRRQAELIGRMVSASGLSAQVGGGIRTAEEVSALLDAKVNRVVIGSLAVKDRAATDALFETFGPDRLVLALDIHWLGEEPMAATSGWRETGALSLWELIDHYLTRDLKHVLCTDIDRDGTLVGPNLELYAKVLQRYPNLELQASGGVGKLGDLQALSRAGIPAAIVGKALYEGRFSLGEALQC